MRAVKSEISNEINAATKMLSELKSTISTVIPTVTAATGAVVAGPSIPPSYGGPRIGSMDGRPRGSDGPRERPNLPPGWLDAEIDKVGPSDGYARAVLGIKWQEGGRYLSAHILNNSGPIELRRRLRVGDKVKVKVQWDDLGVRVTELVVPFQERM